MTGCIFGVVGLFFFMYFDDVYIVGLVILGWFVFIMMLGTSGLGYVSLWGGYDCLSMCLILLSIWLTGLAMFVGKGGQSYVMLILLLCFCLSFGAMDLMLFYYTFEMTLIPLFLLVVGYGSQPERLQASLYFLFYTMVGSLPLFFSLLNYYDMVSSLNYYFLWSLDISVKVSMWFFLLFGFMLKLPVFTLHLWLPSAHVEAPVSGSMLLAGVLLKLGGYGFVRVLPMVSGEFLSVSGYFISWGLGGGLMAGLLCMRQSDVSSLVAYSSVGHMGLMLAGYSTLGVYGIMGGMLMMISHGLTSSGMFYSVNIWYSRLHTRSLYLYRGWLSISSSFILFWFILCVSNMAAPPFLNLVSELWLGIGLLSYSMWVVLVLGLFFFFSACYNLYLYSLSSHGGCYLSFGFSSLFIQEYFILFLHTIPLFLLVLSLDLLWLI